MYMYRKAKSWIFLFTVMYIYYVCIYIGKQRAAWRWIAGNKKKKQKPTSSPPKLPNRLSQRCFSFFSFSFFFRQSLRAVYVEGVFPFPPPHSLKAGFSLFPQKPKPQTLIPFFLSRLSRRFPLPPPLFFFIFPLLVFVPMCVELLASLPEFFFSFFWSFILALFILVVTQHVLRHVCGGVCPCRLPLARATYSTRQATENC